MMGLQFGVLARLTWWEYSWDIMEPVTYFVTYGTTMAMFAYYVCTKQVTKSIEYLHLNGDLHNFTGQNILKIISISLFSLAHVELYGWEYIH